MNESKRLEGAGKVHVAISACAVGVPVKWVAEKLCMSKGELEKELTLLGIAEQRKEKRDSSEVFQSVLRYYKRCPVNSGEALTGLLGEWLGINSLRTSFAMLDRLAEKMTIPLHLPEHAGYVKLLQAIFEKSSPKAEGAFNDYLSDIGTNRMYYPWQGSRAGLKTVKFIPVPQNIEELENGFLEYFAQACQANIGPIWSENTPTQIEEALKEISSRRAHVLRARFAIGGPKQTLRQIAVELKVTPECIRQLEIRTLRTLRHPDQKTGLMQFIKITPLCVPSLPPKFVGDPRVLNGSGTPHEQEAERLASFKDYKIEHLILSVRTMNCLKRVGIDTILDLVYKTEGDLLLIQGFGRKSLNELKDVLSEIGLYLGMRP